MAYDFQTGLGGVGAGASTGAAIGSFGGPPGTAIGAGIGALLGLGTGFLKKPKRPSVNIDSELVRLRGLYQAQRDAALAGVNENLGELNKQTAEGLAGRGIYSSPVSENYFARNRRGAQSALAQAYGNIGSNQANAESALLSKLLGLDYENKNAGYEDDVQARNDIFSGLTGLSLAYLNSKSPKGAQTNVPAGWMNPAYRRGSTYNNRLSLDYNPDQTAQLFPGLYRS